MEKIKAIARMFVYFRQVLVFYTIIQLTEVDNKKKKRIFESFQVYVALTLYGNFQFKTMEILARTMREIYSKFNKDIRTTSMTSFCGVFIINFEQVLHIALVYQLLASST